MIADWFAPAAFWTLLFALMALEAWLPMHRSPREGEGRLVANFGLGVLNAALFAALPLSTVLAATWAENNSFGLMNDLAVPAAAAFAVTILLRSLFAYSLHVAAHRLPLLWRMHRVHHADTAVDLSTGFRHHPLELLFVAGCHAALAVSLGLSVAALIVYEVAAIALTLWSHVNLRLPARLERFAAWVVVTPTLHHVHHSARQAETDSNYGELFTLWDRLFGTYRRLDPSELASMPIGLGDRYDANAARLLRQLASPFRAEADPSPSASKEALEPR